MTSSKRPYQQNTNHLESVIFRDPNVSTSIPIDATRSHTDTLLAADATTHVLDDVPLGSGSTRSFCPGDFEPLNLQSTEQTDFMLESLFGIDNTNFVPPFWGNMAL